MMTDEEVGVYIRLLLCQWANGEVPNNERRMRGLLNGASDSAIGYVLADKFVETDTGYVNERMRLVREEALAFRERRSEAGRKAASARWGDATGNAIASETHPRGNAIAITSNLQSPLPKIEDVYGQSIQSLTSLLETPSLGVSKIERRLTGEMWGVGVARYKIALDRVKPRTGAERKLVALAAILSVSDLSEAWLATSIRGVTETNPREPLAVFRSCCRERAEKMHGAQFDDLAADLGNVPKSFYEAARGLPGTLPEIRCKTSHAGRKTAADIQRELAECQGE